MSKMERVSIKSNDISMAFLTRKKVGNRRGCVKLQFKVQTVLAESSDPDPEPGSVLSLQISTVLQKKLQKKVEIKLIIGGRCCI